MSRLLQRYIHKSILSDLDKKMVFLAGPRQVGKTTFARQLLEDAGMDSHNRYLNWDAPDDREMMIREQFPPEKGLLVLDEIHKYSRWRQVVKGLYDKRETDLRILVTGSAKLDHYRHGGDSLQGRYYFHRLHPLTLAEIRGGQGDLNDLLAYGGFPEPFMAGSEKETRRWSRDYRSRLIREDLADLERVKDLGLMENLAIRLPDLVGAPLSINALREDLQVAHQTVAKWVGILENLYAIFRIYPFGAPRIRAVKKEAKHYHMDWTVVSEKGLRFENMVACHLLKWCHFLQDTEGRDLELRYFRDIDRREVDFVLMENQRPTHFIECKVSAKTNNRALQYLKQRFARAKALQITLEEQRSFEDKDGIVTMPAVQFLSELV